ncbi:MAG: YdcF family protein [Chitinophagaceae bacterium]|nr:YdcF family protein [Chitinophagaceae bacterium]
MGLLFLPAALIVSACSFSGKASKKLLEKAIAAAPYDVIIVPGNPLKDGKWNRVMKGRVYWSKYLFEKGIAKNIIYSGSSVYSPYYEGQVMAFYALSLGIPKENIYTELKAEHTTENIYYSYQYAKKLGFKKIAVASDPFQTRTVRGYARRRVSPDIALIPFVTDTLKMIEPEMIDPVIDYQKAFNPDFISIKKRDSFWKRMRGTIRGNIDAAAYK